MNLRSSACLIALFHAPLAFAGDWLSWRGPHGTGMADGPGPAAPAPALQWTPESGIAWVVPIPGRGCSTPIAVGEHLFLTTAVDAPPERSERAEDNGAPDADAPELSEVDAALRRLEAERALREQRFLALCIDRTSGAVVWEKELARALPHEGYNFRYGSYASRSPVSDGARVYASFGTWGIHALDLEGNLLWTADPGVVLTMRKGYGEGSAPTVHGNVLVHLFDHEGDSFIAAYDTRDGKELWRTARDEESTWAQPVILEHEGVLQVVASGENAVRSYALDSGTLLWERAGLGRAVISTPIHHGGLVIAMTGHGGGANIMAIRLGGAGVLADDAIAWSCPKGAAYTSTPLLAGNDLYVLTDLGFLSCFDATTGVPHFMNKRLPRDSHLKASPVGAGGRMYVATESGQVHVLSLTHEKVDVLATHRFEDEVFIASPIIVDGNLYLRSLERLYCIREPTGLDR